jgi:hypothetical protein
MSALGFAFVTFICTFAAALLGTVIRTALPQEHVTKESQDAIRLGMGLIATMTALLLGLVTAAAKGTFDSQDRTVKDAAANIVVLDRLLARYGSETQPTRDLLRRALAARIDATWPPDGGKPGAPDQSQARPAPPAGEEVENQILRLSPETDAQRWFKSQALSQTENVMRARWGLHTSAGGAVNQTFLVLVIFWLAMTFASFGFGAPRNATVVTVFLVAAFSVAAAVFLIFELDSAFDGIVRVSSDPLRRALATLGQ